LSSILHATVEPDIGCIHVVVGRVPYNWVIIGISYFILNVGYVYSLQQY